MHKVLPSQCFSYFYSFIRSLGSLVKSITAKILDLHVTEILARLLKESALEFGFFSSSLSENVWHKYFQGQYLLHMGVILCSFHLYWFKIYHLVTGCHVTATDNQNICVLHCQTRESTTPQASLSDFIATEHLYFQTVSISAAWIISRL